MRTHSNFRPRVFEWFLMKVPSYIESYTVKINLLIQQKKLLGCTNDGDKYFVCQNDKGSKLTIYMLLLQTNIVV